MIAASSKILAIDIGGSHIKGAMLDINGSIVVPYLKLPTPQPANPAAVLQTITELTKNMQGFTHISIGFPGLVKNNVVMTAPNLDAANWKKIAFADMVTSRFDCPAKIINDADMLGLGVVTGKGLEMMITLGTGFGTAFLQDGKLLPHFEIAHLPVKKDTDYDQYIGQAAFERLGVEKWNVRLQKVLSTMENVFNYDTLFLGGGNAKKINFSLPENIKIVTNKDGIDGGVKLWKMQDK